ncbi:leucine-rich repeat-containing protein 15 isoform X2 [Nasonia vitripennis]|uniref:LRRCT domain-containing protein n=1 Tax=Nasonia vitripennis TaxID=7425 RepID=A0A7M7HBM3_NASVI|nr:leucine-rich repeat-containing protein 15 isoform X2 [Nasonia vitripennis]
MNFILLLLFYFIFLLHYSKAYVVDIGNIWEVKCPRECSCALLRYADLPLHQWINSTNDFEDSSNHVHGDHPLANELLKVATCVIFENPSKLLSKMPEDVQIFTILESGSGDTEMILQASDMQRFADLLSLDIQGMESRDPLRITSIEESKSGIILSADTLLPLGTTLLYLNLERVTLTRLSITDKSKANLVIKPRNLPEDNEANIYNENQSGHRLIFLSQQSGNNNDDKEILPYDIYKQEMEGYRESAGVFAGLSALSHLRVYDCALKDVSWHMFDGLENLQYLSLQRNDLKFIPEFCFYGTPNLKQLSLANNELLTLKSVDLAGLLMLEKLDLSGNNLTFLSELSFPPFPALTSADFRENPFESIFPSTFEIMNRTTHLKLGGNGAKLKLEKNAFLGLKNLEVLHIYNIEIPVLERYIFQGMPSLMELKLRGNISTIEFDAFIDLKSIVTLDLSHCLISKISMDAFYGLENVKRIDLSYNNLDYIPPGLFSMQQQKQLREIILTKNNLLKLPPDFFKSLRLSNKQFMVENIRLDGNPWDCNCDMTKWNPHLINRTRETAPRCFTPKSLRNYGIFYALRKGGLDCKWRKRRLRRKQAKLDKTENNEIDNEIS